MAMCRGFVFLALLAAGTVAQNLVTPVEKVITLINNMKTEAEKEGREEATTYSEYSCFCKDTTLLKSKALTTGSDKVVKLSANIEMDTATKNEDSAELSTQKKKKEKNIADRMQNKHDCEEDEAEYREKLKDTTNAIFGLTQAIESMEKTKPALLQAEVQTSLLHILALSDAMGMLRSPQHKAVAELLQAKDKAAFLQQRLAVDPADPEYKYHSDGIISLCRDLKVKFEADKKALDDDWKANDQICKDTEKRLAEAIENNDKAIKMRSKSIEDLSVKISTDLGTLEETRALMEDDKAYLQDLTKQCEERAKDWDQRSAMRANELATLTEALKILNEKVSPTDQAANKRALVQRSVKAHVDMVNHSSPQKASASAAKVVPHSISFLQDASASQRQQSSDNLSDQTKKDHALMVLRKEGTRLHSMVLQSLVARVAGDPFMKVKELIQKLIERLVAEATGEAEKKGFCDEEMGKAKKDRDYRNADAMKLSAEIAELEAKRDELTAEISTLKSEIKDLKSALAEATKARRSQKDGNLKTISTAQEGLTALKECIEILQTFYRVSDRATVLAQVSPVDEDTEGPGFKGAYKGQQTRSVAILDMLDDIKSDYERTLKHTTEEEASAHADYTEFKRTSEADISGKSKKQALDEEDLTSTLATIETKMDDLKATMDLLDAAVKTLEQLNPTCVDSGMSYKERVEKREEEIAALKKALCQLDAEKVESECQ